MSSRLKVYAHRSTTVGRFGSLRKSISYTEKKALAAEAKRRRAAEVETDTEGLEEAPDREERRKPLETVVPGREADLGVLARVGSGFKKLFKRSPRGR